MFFFIIYLTAPHGCVDHAAVTARMILKGVEMVEVHFNMPSELSSGGTEEKHERHTE
jgi:hypothetical protein